MLEFRIDKPTPLSNKWLRTHYHEKKKIMQEFMWLVKAACRIPETPIDSCVIEVDRYSAGDPDWDGLYGGLKPLLDVLVVPTKRNPCGLGIIVDDNTKIVKDLRAKPYKAKRKEGYTVVRIIEV